MDKTQAIINAKGFRNQLDEILQRMKCHGKDLIGNTTDKQDFLNHGESCAQHTISVRELENAIMRQGMTLKNIGNPEPYPVSKITPESLAGTLYGAYCVSTGGKSAVSGNPLPEWDRLQELAKAGDTAMQKVVAGWIAVANTHPAMTRVEPTSDGVKL